jgi:hypothetical protein
VQYSLPDTERLAEAAKLYKVHKSTGCILSSKDAINLLVQIIEKPDGGANLNLSTLKVTKSIKVSAAACVVSATVGFLLLLLCP